MEAERTHGAVLLEVRGNLSKLDSHLVFSWPDQRTAGQEKGDDTQGRRRVQRGNGDRGQSTTESRVGQKMLSGQVLCSYNYSKNVYLSSRRRLA